MESRLELTRQAVDAHFWFRGFRKFVFPAIEAAVQGRRDLRLLDCGSGTGDNLARLARHGTPVGVDLSFGGVMRARSSGFPAAQGNVVALPFADNVFDLATSFDVLQQVDDDVVAMREMARVVRPGGTIVLTLAALECLHGDHNVVWDEVRRYTRASATRLVTGAGLEPVQVSYIFAVLFPLLLASRTLQRLTRRFRRLSEQSDISVPPPPINAAMTWLVTAEAILARVVPMPIGSSLLVVARKPARAAV